MRTVIHAWVALGVFLIALSASADEQSEQQPAAYPPVQLAEVLDSVSKKSGRVFLTSARAPSEIIVGQVKVKDITYPTLLVILANNGLAAVTTDDITNIIHDATIRQHALPMLYEDDDSIAEFEWINRIVEIQNGHAPQFVPLLRPLLPQMGHLVADGNSNTLLIAGRYGNTKRLVAIIKAMDERSVKQD